MLLADNTNLHIRLQTQTNNISFLGNLARDFQSRLNVLAEKSTEQEHQAEMFETGSDSAIPVANHQLKRLF